MTYLGRVEVRSFALVEPVMTVQLQFGTGQSGPAIVVGSTRSNSEGSVVASLENPCELLHWVIHVQPDIRRPGRRSRRDGLCAGELGHGHEILMARLAEAFPLGGIQVDERGVEVRGRLDRGIDTVGGHVRGALERDVEANLVVLECNCKTGVEWYTSECVCVRSRSCGEETWTQSVTMGVRIRTQRQSQGRALAEKEGQRDVEPLDHSSVTTGGRVLEIDHTPVGRLLVRRMVQFAVHAQPVGIQLINTLSTDLQFDFLEQLLGREMGLVGSMLLHRHLDIDGVEEITVPGNRHGRALSESYGTREGALNRLKRERRVPVLGWCV